MTYANNKNIEYVIMVGDTEINENKVTLKNMETGDQQMISFDEVIKILA